ncbi:MAG: glycosyltransferase, partial [Candidatus Omnitrophica bacterium]|nr:glycosyltransferase [Candidatus Omnitrophota bacterium]
TLSLMEKELARRSDVILAMTQELLRRYKNINVNTHLFPSAVDYEMFRKYLDGNLRLPHDMADIKKPRIGILGYLDANILDLDLLTYLSERHSSWSFVVIGPKHKKTRELDKFLRRKNVHYLGEKKHEAAPLYLRFIDIGLIPYKVNNFTVNVSPLKLYEYLSLGKPVVSTSLPDLAQYGKIISLSENRDEFEGAIRRILNEKKDRKSWERIEIARNNSWQKRYERVKELLDITDKKQ